MAACIHQRPSFKGRAVEGVKRRKADSRATRHGRCRQTAVCSVADQAVGLGLFFTPGLLTLVYAYFKGKGNLKDGLSRTLTEVSQGYFQPNVGGESIPVAQGELSDLAGDEPLFKALYQWCVVQANLQNV